MLMQLVFLAAIAGAAPQAQQPPAAPDFRTSGLWVDWKTLSKESREAEDGGARPPNADGPELQRLTRAAASALGARVGELVATGDCAGGERLAREAGDFALVRAVRAHCEAGRR